MRLGRPMIIAGAFVLIFGLIFHLQGLSIVGPESSFMYSNPEWINYGTQIAVIGIVIIVVGIGIWIKSSR